MSKPIAIREALAQEAGFLSSLALRSKAHWGYSEQFLAACREELTVDSRHLDDGDCQCFVATQGKTVLGFYAMRQVNKKGEYELDALFVEPEFIGRGIGRLLMQHAVRTLSGRGAERLTIQGDPNATKFYIAVGARQAGERESGSVPGRFLPLFEIDIAVS